MSEAARSPTGVSGGFMRMPFFLPVLAFALLLMPSSGEAKKKKAVMGGSCSYEEFGGSCTVTGKGKEGRSIFSFVGEVDGEEVRLNKNVMMGGMSMPEGSMACNLLFIKKGTCTPCVFSIGECGSEAWDLFRARADSKKKKK